VEALGGRTLSQLSATLLRAIDPDAIAQRATGRPGASPSEVMPEPFEAARKLLADEACAPFDRPELRDVLAKAKQTAEQTIDTVTIDAVVSQGFDAAAKDKAASLVTSFRAYIEEHRAEIAALQILYSRPYKQRLTESMLKELERKLRDTNARWNEEILWKAFAASAPGKVKGRSAVNRFADLVPLVRFALAQQPMLEPFADSVGVRFERWLVQKASDGTVFNDEQRAWLELIRNHIATSLSIEPEDFELAPFNQRGGLGRAAQLFGNGLAALLDDLNGALAA
jgi:type I restriction enzyme R subunit